MDELAKQGAMLHGDLARLAEEASAAKLLTRDLTMWIAQQEVHMSVEHIMDTTGFPEAQEKMRPWIPASGNPELFICLPSSGFH